MSGVQAANGCTPSEVPTNLDEITDEEFLRHLWQEAENYSERRRIRSRMYKLREKRLREMVQNDEESLGTLATTDQGSYRVEKSEAKVTVTNPQRKSSNIEINLQVRGDSAVTDSISMHNVKLGGLTMRGLSTRDTKRPPSDEEIIDEKVEETKKTRNNRFNKIMSSYETSPADESIISVSKSTYSVQNNALAGDSYQSMKHKEVRDSASPTRYDYSRRTVDTYRDEQTIKSSDDISKTTKKQPSIHGRTQKDSVKKITERKLSKDLTTSPIVISKNTGKQNAVKLSSKEALKPSRKIRTKEVSPKNEFNKLDSYLNINTDSNDELITEEEEVAEDDSGNIVKMLVQTRRKKDGTEYMSRRIARTTKVVDSEKDINEILIGNPDHEIVCRNVEEKDEADGSKIKIISETRRRPDGIEYETRNVLKTCKIFDYDHPENVRHSEDDELIETKQSKEIDDNGVEILSVTEIRRKSTGEKYTTKKVYKTSKVTSEISPSVNDEVLDREMTEETSPDGVNVKIITEKRKTQNGEEYTHRQVFKARKMTLSDIELQKGLPSLTSEDEIVDKKESEEKDEVGNVVKKVTELRRKRDGSQYSFDYVIRSVKCTEQEINDIPYKVCEAGEINTSDEDELIREDVKEEIQEDGITVKTIIERRKGKDGAEYLRHRIIRIPKLPEPEFQVASNDDELLEKDINEDILDDGTKFRAITERRRSSTTGLQYTLRRMSKVFHPTIHLFGVDESIDENVTEEETSDGVLTRTVIRRYQRPDDSVYTTHNVNKTYKNPVQVMPDECSKDELVDRSYDVRETLDGFLIRTVMETRCRSDGVHYTVERTEKISKNKSGQKASKAENDSLTTGSPGDTVISREQHEEPGETGIIIKTVIEVRKRKDGTEYTNKSTVKTTQILVPEHETSYVIIKPDPKNATGKDLMPSLKDEIVYTRNKEEIDDKGNTINVIVETRKSSMTGEKYNLTKRVRTTDVVMTDHGEKVLLKNKQKGEEFDTNIRQFSKNNTKQDNKRVSRILSSNVDRNLSVKKSKEEVERISRSANTALVQKNRNTETKTLSSTTDDDVKRDSMHKKNVKSSLTSSKQVKDRSRFIGSSAKMNPTKIKIKSESATSGKNITANVNNKNKKLLINQKSSESSSETPSEGCSPERLNSRGKFAAISKKSQQKAHSSDEGNDLSAKSVQRIGNTDRSYKNKITEKKETILHRKDNKSLKNNASEGELHLKSSKPISKKSRSSDDDSTSEIKQRENKMRKSVTGSQLDKKSVPREVNYHKSVSYTGTVSSSVPAKASAFKRVSLPGEDNPLTVKSNNEKAINYVNLVKKRYSKGTIEKIDEKSSDINRTSSTNKTAAIRDKYSNTIVTDTNYTSKKDKTFKLDNSILSQIIPDIPKVNDKRDSRTALNTSNTGSDNVTSKRSMFEKYSDVKSVVIQPPTKKEIPVIEPVIVPKYIEPMCKNDRSNSVDLSNMKSKDLNLASTKLVMDTMHSEPKHQRENSPSKDIPEREFSPKRSSISDYNSVIDAHHSEINTKKMSISSVDSLYYERRDSDSSFAKEGSPSRFITGKAIDQGVNTKKIKKLERAGSHKKLLEDLEPSSIAFLSFSQKIEAISDLTELENILNTAENYEERRIIRGRIRNVKRANQSQQSNRLDKPASDKYSFKTPSTLSPQIQRRSHQFIEKPADVTRRYDTGNRLNVKSTKTNISPSSAVKSCQLSSSSKTGEKQSEIRKISSSTVGSHEERSESIIEKRKINSCSNSEIKRKSITESIFGKGGGLIEPIETTPKISSDSFSYSRRNFELRSQKEKLEDRKNERSKIEIDAKRQPYNNEPNRYQKCNPEWTGKVQTDVEKIISPYGVGPTDENGVPLFGLKALKRRNKPTDIQPKEETRPVQISKDETTPTSSIKTVDVDMQIKKNISVVEREDINEGKFETDSLNMDPDSLSEAEDEEEKIRSRNFKNIVKLHELKVIEPIATAEPSSPPKQKLRLDFVGQEDKTDHKAYKTWDLENDLITRSQGVENIIAKHETLKESPKVEKRLTGILKKSNSSLTSSKVIAEKEIVSEDVEELGKRKYSSDVSSDFCSIQNSGRKSSFTEVLHSTPAKASKKKNQGLLDNSRQTTDKPTKRKEKLLDTIASLSERKKKKSRKHTFTEHKNNIQMVEKDISKTIQNKHSKSKSIISEDHSDLNKTKNEKNNKNLQTKTNRSTKDQIEKKSNFIDTSKINAITVNNSKTKRSRDKRTDVIKDLKNKKPTQISEETHSALTSMSKSSVGKSVKIRHSDVKRSVIKKSIPEEPTEKESRNEIKVKKNFTVKKNKTYRERNNLDEKIDVKMSIQTTSESDKGEIQNKDIKHKKDSNKKVNKIVNRNSMPKSAKLVSNVQHTLENNAVSLKFETKRSRKINNESSKIVPRNDNNLTTPIEQSISTLTNRKSVTTVKENTAHGEKEAFAKQIVTDPSSKLIKVGRSADNVKINVKTVTPLVKENEQSNFKIAEMASTISNKEIKGVKKCLIKCDESLSETIRMSDVTTVPEGDQISKHKYKNLDEKASNFSRTETKKRFSGEKNDTCKLKTTKIKPFPSLADESSSKRELIITKTSKNEKNISEMKKVSSCQLTSKQSAKDKLHSEESASMNNCKTQKFPSHHQSMNYSDSKLKTVKSTEPITKVHEILEKHSSGEKEISLTSNLNIKLQEPIRKCSKEIPNYMRPKSTSRRRSTPEKEPQELENILLNSYMYTRCTKKVPIQPVSYDYTYVINKDSKPAGSNCDSYSVYFGPRDKLPLSEVEKRYSITSDTLSIAEENFVSEDIKKSFDQDVNLISNTVIQGDKRPSNAFEIKVTNEENNFPEITKQSLESVHNVGMDSKESHTYTQSGIFEKENFSPQHNLETDYTNSQRSAYLDVPEVTTVQTDQLTNRRNETNMFLTDKELQQKYNYQVERKDAEILESQNSHKKEITTISSEADHSSIITDKFNIDFNKVYADKMEKYYKSGTKHEETDEKWSSTENKYKMHSGEELPISQFINHSAESFEPNDSYCFTFDGRPVVPKPLSVRIVEPSTNHLALAVSIPEVKECFERTSQKEESTNEREYSSKYESSRVVATEQVSDMPDAKSFLNDSTKVTGISDVLSRMGATEAVDHEAKVTSDDQARSLLNRFLGAQVLMTGVESMMAQSAPSQNRTPAAFGQGITNTTPSNIKTTSSSVQQSAPDIIQGVNIAKVNDSFELNELLDSCEGYDERRRIRLRLKDVVAQEKASGDIIGLKKVTSTTRRIAGSKVATVGLSEGKGTSAFNKFKQIDGQQSRTTSGPQTVGPLFTFSASLNRSASGVKDMIMTWCRGRTRNYKGVNIENFSTSWNDGLAFCALIHHFYPDAFNFDALNPKNRRYNFALAFRIADERAEVYPLLDVEDMVAMQKPDWKCVFTYVQTLYKRLKDE